MLILALFLFALGILYRLKAHGWLYLWFLRWQWRRGKLTFAMHNFEATRISAGLPLEVEGR